MKMKESLEIQYKRKASKSRKPSNEVRKREWLLKAAKET